MKKISVKIIIYSISVFLIFLHTNPVSACTIFSAIAKNGHVWNGNNEDGPFGVANFINVYPQTAQNKYGYYTLTYFSPSYGQSGSVQGGMNEAGLTFDFNAISYVDSFDPSTKQAFPGGDNAILVHILGNMSTTEEVVEFFSTYWFQNGFRGAQMHVADKNGRFAIISASGSQIAEKGAPLVSTNFDICGKADGSSCWRFPIATEKINKEGASFSTFKAICEATAQKNGGTMYSNIHNLTTGDIWFFSKHDAGNLVKTNIKDLISKGRTSYSFSNLGEILKSNIVYKWEKPNKVSLTDDELNLFSGEFHNSFIGKVKVFKGAKEIQILFEGGKPLNFYPFSKTEFFFPDEDIKVEFVKDEKEQITKMRLYEAGKWSFTAWRKEE